jgi:hypothetical protein
LRGVERCSDRFLTVGVVARDVEELAGRARHAAPESVDEGHARRAVRERRDGVIVGRTGELSVALGEASYVLVETLSRLLLAVAQLPLLAGACVSALEVPDVGRSSRGSWPAIGALAMSARSRRGRAADS